MFQRSKYRNKKTQINGILFDSKREAERYQELILLQKAGEISDLELQPRFLLLKGFKYNGKTYRKVEYIADFKYKTKGGSHIVEDVKGVETDVFKLKKKMFLSLYGNEFQFQIVR